MANAPSLKVFTVKRAYSPALFTIRVNDRQAVVAFRHKSTAARFVALDRQLNGRGGKEQPVQVDDLSLKILWRRCSQNSLQLVVFNDRSEYEIFDTYPLSVDDMQFYLENNTRYCE